jgi:hypothetical protein
MELHYIVGISCPCAFRFILRSFGGNAGITNQGLNTRVNGAIGTTAASSLVTGFTDTISPFEVYTITPLNNGLVNGILLLHQEMLQAAKALEGLNAARDLYNSISPANKPGGSDQGSGELGINFSTRCL